MSLNKWVGYGRLCADPDYRQTTSGVPVCSFTVAVNRNYRKDGEQDADFISCTAWRQTAEFINKYFRKGSAIIVEGSLHNNNYTDKNGVKHYGMDIAVDQVNFGESKKNATESTQNAPQSGAPQFGVVTPKVQQASHTAQSGTNAPQSSAQPEVQQFDLSEFEEILSDGAVPF